MYICLKPRHGTYGIDFVRSRGFVGFHREERGFCLDSGLFQRELATRRVVRQARAVALKTSPKSHAATPQARIPTVCLCFALLFRHRTATIRVISTHALTAA